MTILLSVLTFLVIFSILVIGHEFGHFLFARRAGMKVEEFGFGLPPRMWGKKTSRLISYQDKSGRFRKKKETMIWSFNWIPFGGFVKILGEDDDSKEAKKDPRSFGNRPILARILFVLGGVLVNFLIGWLLLIIVFTSGSQPIVTSPADIEKNIQQGIITTIDGVQIIEVTDRSVAKEAGLLDGDIIVSVDNKNIKKADDLINKLKEKPRGEGFHINVKRIEARNRKKNLTYIIKPNKEGKIGVILNPLPVIDEIHKIKLPLHKATIFALKETGRISVLTVKMLGNVIVNIAKKFSVPEEVGGPVMIAKMTHDFVKIGDVIQIMIFMALISISLAVVNIMPFPALDGGRLLFLLFELITRKKPNAKWEAAIHAGGFVILLGLIFLVTWNDIVRIFFN